MNEAFLQALQQVLFDPYVWMVIIGAALFGVFMGSVPGLTATMAVALLIPVVYFMDPIPALAALVTLVVCAIFAGDIPNAMLRIPGTPASAAYTDDAYQLTRSGKGEQALGTCLMFSVAGGIVGVLVLILFAPFLASFAARTFSVIEYFWLYLLGLTCAVVVSRDSTLRGLFGLIIGLLLACIGLSAVHAEARLTFGIPELYQGVNFIPAMIGLFGVSEILRNMLSLDKEVKPTAPLAQKLAQSQCFSMRNFFRKLTGGVLLSESAPFLWKRKFHALRSGAIGSFVGMLPGAGADIASWVSVAASKKFSKRPQDFGKGSMECVGDGAAAKNGALAGAWVPALVFAVPGDSVTAIIIGVLLMKDIVPGPDIFVNQADIVYSIYILFVLSNLVLIVVGIAAIKTGYRIQMIPKRLLLPLILLFCITGSYAINGSYFDVLVMGLTGILGFVLDRRNVPLGPVGLGIILGPPLEERFIQTMTAAEGNLLAFFSRPVAAGLGILVLTIWVSMALRPVLARARK